MRLSLLLHATRSYFPFPPARKPENVYEIMLRFEGGEEELALAETRLDGGGGYWSGGNAASGGASSRTGELRKGEEGRVEVERLTRHVIPDKAGECVFSISARAKERKCRRDHAPVRGR